MNFPYLPNALKLFFMEKAREFQKISFCFTDYTKAFDSVNHNSGKFLKSWEYQTKLPASRETCTQVKKQQLEPNMEQLTGSNLGKEYNILSSCLFNLYGDSVQFSSVTQLCSTLCDPMNCSTPGLPVHHQLLESTQTHVHWVGDAIQTSHLLLSPSPSAHNLSQHQGLFKWVRSLHQVAKVLEFQLQHQSFHEHPGLIFFRMDWLDLLAVKGTLKSLLQNHSSKASILWRSAFFTVQLPHPYMTTGKTKSLTRWTLVGKVMFLLLIMLSNFHS